MPPLQELDCNMLSVKELEARISHAKPWHIETQAPGILSRELPVFESLPSIQQWVLKRGCDKKLTAVLTVLAIMKKNPIWLRSVIEELQVIVTIGEMSNHIWELSQALIQCLAQQGSPHAAKLTTDLIMRMLKEEDCTNFKVTSVIYTLVMRTAPASAEDLFKILMERHLHNPLRCKPTASNRIALIVAMAKGGQCHRALKFLWTDAPVSLFNILLSSFKSPEEADILLSKMEVHLYGLKGTKPNQRSFHVVARKWVSIDSICAHAVLERALAWEKSYSELRPTVGFFVDVMKAFVDSPEQVEKLLVRLEAHIACSPVTALSKSEYQLSPAAFEVCMAAWAKNGKPQHVDRLLNTMMAKAVKPSRLCWAIAVKSWIAAGDVEKADKITRRAGYSADVDLCNLVLLGWGEIDARRAGYYFDWMRRQTGHNKADTNSHQIMSKVWKRSRSKHASDHVKHLLQRLKLLTEEGRVRRTPNVSDSAMSALQGAKHKLQVLNLWKKIESVQKYDISSYVTAESCTLALSSSLEIGLVKDLFMRMEKADVTATSVSLSCVVVALAKSSVSDASSNSNVFEQKVSAHFCPDIDSCNSVLAICLTNPSPQASKTSRSMLQHMMREYKAGNPKMRPKASAFTRLFVKLYAARKKIPASAALDMVEGIQFPDEQFALSCYTYALTVCAWSRDHEAPNYAKRLWQKLDNPPLDCLNLVLATFAAHPKHSVSAKAEPMLHANETRLDWQPNAISVHLVIEAVSKSRRQDAAQQAFALLQRFQSQITSSLSLSHVLLACAMTLPTDKKLHNYNLACRAFSNWKEKGRVVNSLHYLRMLTCAIRLAPNSKARIIMATRVFDACCSDGLVDRLILRRFWSMASETVRKQLLGPNGGATPLARDLPSAWTRWASSKPFR